MIETSCIQYLTWDHIAVFSSNLEASSLWIELHEFPIFLCLFERLMGHHWAFRFTHALWKVGQALNIVARSSGRGTNKLSTWNDTNSQCCKNGVRVILANENGTRTERKWQPCERKRKEAAETDRSFYVPLNQSRSFQANQAEVDNQSESVLLLGPGVR